MNEMRNMTRQPVSDTKAYWMSVISFKEMDWTELIAKVVDMSPHGVGIEARSKMDPGFVWFSEKVDGSRGPSYVEQAVGRQVSGRNQIRPHFPG